MARMTKEELLEKLFHEDYEQLKVENIKLEIFNNAISSKAMHL